MPSVSFHGKDSCLRFGLAHFLRGTVFRLTFYHEEYYIKKANLCLSKKLEYRFYLLIDIFYCI